MVPQPPKDRVLYVEDIQAFDETLIRVGVCCAAANIPVGGHRNRRERRQWERDKRLAKKRP